MTPERPLLRVVRMGEAARASLRPGMSGRVLAVFRRTFYLIDCQGGVVCIGDASLGAGPLNAACASLSDWQAEPLSPGDETRVARGVLAIGDGLALCLDGAEAWRRAASPTFRGFQALRYGLQCLAELARMQAPADGLGRTIRPPAGVDGDALSEWGIETSPVTKAAEPGIDALRSWLVGRLGRAERAVAPSPAVISLVGLGPGLTPSGDDFLGGAAVALHGLGRADVAGELAVFLAGHLQSRTGLISGAHLRQALGGEACAPTLDAMDAVLSGLTSRVDAACRAAATVGHTSGWDALGGLALAAAAFLEASPQGAAEPASRCA